MHVVGQAPTQAVDPRINRELGRIFRATGMLDGNGQLLSGFRAAADALRRLAVLVDGNPDVWEVFPLFELPASAFDGMRQFYQQPDRYANLNDRALETLADLAVVQRLHGISRMPNDNGEGKRRFTLIPGVLQREATTANPEVPSIAALERRIRDFNPIAYKRYAAKAGLQPLDQEGLVRVEQALVTAYFLKDAARIWYQLPRSARDILNQLGFGIPEPWEVYVPVPNASPSARVLRLLYLVEATRGMAQKLENTRHPLAHDPIAVWELGELTGWQPPAGEVRERLKDPSGPEGVVPAPTLLALAIQAKLADPQTLRNLTAKYGETTVDWLRRGTPSIMSFDRALAFPKEWLGALSYARVVRLTRDYFDVLSVPVLEEFCAPGPMSFIAEAAAALQARR